MPFRCTKPIPNVVQTITSEPWKIAIDPFQVAPRTYYVAGQRWVGCYLIDTGSGLVLIDTGVQESAHLLVDSIYRLGFDPHDIRVILVSHAHVDHCGGAALMRELTGAKLYMSREDLEFMRTAPEETLALDPRFHAWDFEPDALFHDEDPVELGAVSIRTTLTPGHTIGCTSFRWDVENPVDGARYTVGMHGGVGANTMNDAYYSTSKVLTAKLRERFIADLDRVGSWHVDIALPSHPNQIEILDRAGSYTDEKQPYLDASIWRDFLAERVRQVNEYDEAAIAAMLK
ncbi:hypothetical protein Corgl_1341 [Coriobacterium glomerans PW2]|uniref:Metallo-beta-lactamase domain-containing protein n=1 Tax=Coriobacterium glomerans (strain ATCC 49209 / DSM 20642 / JCM 10262 / PW2) TaxID=700015 RepID=F2N8Q9_CORGP|nr:MBL fold metallo-hydrolase [Coriobacterium glomerans]AEB07442.1 hypothetical protein Corgl_1341 [Coriobacterium glomerans PW2]